MPTVHRAISWILNRFGVHRRAVSRTPISGHAYNKAPIYHNHDTFLWAEPMQNRPSTPSDAASALLSALWLCDHPTPMPGRLPPRNCLHGGFSRGLLV